VGEIQEMFVVEEKRGLGVGKKLLNKLKQIVRNQDVLHLEVTSGSKRINAHQFYEQQGFQYTSKRFIWIKG
jgi:(aminoalkyl)phosphonate N-acetyltransferase